MPDSPALHWARLFEDHSQGLLAFAISRGLDAHDAEAVTGKILRLHATRGPSLAHGDERRSLQLAVLDEIDRRAGRRRSVRRRTAHAAAPVGAYLPS